MTEDYAHHPKAQKGIQGFHLFRFTGSMLLLLFSFSET